VRSIRGPLRSADAELVDAFLVAAISAVLLIRIYLEATGYPKLGGNGLHVAHVLWGGLGMLVAIVLLLLFLSSTTRLVAALVGGAGFGAFIDELGKFVTSDNDYFFKPTAALVYVTFVLLFLAVRQVRTFRALSPEENLVNAIELSERLVLGRLGESDRVRAVELLRRADQTEPMVAALRTRFAEAAPSTGAPSGARRLSLAASRRYAAIAGSRWFGRLIAAIFILDGLGFVLTVVAGLALVVGVLIGNAEARAAFDETTAGSTVPSLIQVLAGVVAGGMVVAGLVALRRSRSRAYRLFELAILVDLLLVQPFSFLESGFVATLDVFVELALLATLRYLDGQERRLAISHEDGLVFASGS